MRMELPTAPFFDSHHLELHRIASSTSLPALFSSALLPAYVKTAIPNNDETTAMDNSDEKAARLNRNWPLKLDWLHGLHSVYPHQTAARCSVMQHLYKTNQKTTNIEC